MYKFVLLSAVFGACLAVVPTIEIEPGVHMPMAGLGTWLYNDTVAGLAVSKALKLGYTLIDTANGYGNQVGIGKAIKASGRARSTFFVLTKIPGGLSYEEALGNLTLNNKQLGLDYVDLVLVHYPASWSGEGGKEKRQAGWKALEAFKAAGKTRSIGVSHFCARHIRDILEINTTAVSVNQVEFHVGMGLGGPLANDDMDYFKSLGITTMGFSTLCGPCGTTELIKGPLVTGIGHKYGKSGAQVSLKWAVQQGVPVIPKSTSEAHLIENMELFDWTLSEKDMATLTAATSPAAAGGGSTYPGQSGDCEIP